MKLLNNELYISSNFFFYLYADICKLFGPIEWGSRKPGSNFLIIQEIGSKMQRNKDHNCRYT